jgi:DNA-binding transcriptional MerR regulator
MTSGDQLIEWHSAASAARIAGLSLDMVNYLCRNGIVAPSGGSSRGRGKVRKYVYADVLLLRLVAKLLEQEVSVLRLKKCLAALQKRSGNASMLLSKRYLVTDGRSVYFADNNSFESLESGQMAFAFVMELSSIRDDVDRMISRLFKAA